MFEVLAAESGAELKMYFQKYIFIAETLNLTAHEVEEFESNSMAKPVLTAALTPSPV